MVFRLHPSSRAMSRHVFLRSLDSNAAWRFAAIISQSFYERLYGWAVNTGQFGGTMRRIALGTASYRTLENCIGSPSRLTGIFSSVWTSAQGVCQYLIYSPSG